MTFLRYLLSVILFLSSISLASAENIDSTTYSITNKSTFSTGKLTPFWLQSNLAGRIAPQPINNSFSVGILNRISQSKKYSLGFGVEGLFQAAIHNSSVYFHEIYIEGQFYFLNLTIGKQNQNYGNQFEPLSSGGILFSGNCRPIPMISISMPKYTSIPFSCGYIEIKGAFEYASVSDNSYVKNTMLHYKNAFIRVGGSLPLRIYYGIHHSAQWGGMSPVYGDLGSSLNDFWDIVLAKTGNKKDPLGDKINRKGNHIISQNLGIELTFFNFEVNGYWQDIREDGPVKFIFNSPNRPDKLMGISISNNNLPFVQNILVEYFNTTDQSGPYLEKDGIVYGGYDNYFLNYVYLQGYTYYNRTIGTPLITSPVMNINGNPQIVNNSLKAWHIGISGCNKKFKYKLLATKSYNYGLDYYKNINRYLQNYSFLSELSTSVKKLHGIELNVAIGIDHGKLFGNSLGFQIGFRTSHLLLNRAKTKE